MKRENGAISIFVLLAMLFFLAFIMVSYNTVQEKGKSQQSTTKVLKEMYEQNQDVNSIYSEIYSGNSVDFNSVVKTQDQKDAIDGANYIAVDGIIYKK